MSPEPARAVPSVGAPTPTARPRSIRGRRAATTETPGAEGEFVTQPQITETEITEQVDLVRPDGRLNPEAVGWTRRQLHNTDRIGRGRYARGRNKRWEYWNVITPSHILAMTISDIDYAGVHEVWLLDRERGEAFGVNAISPLARRTTLPGTLGRGPARAHAGDLAIAVDELDDGTRLRAITPRVRFDVSPSARRGTRRWAWWCLGVSGCSSTPSWTWPARPAAGCGSTVCATSSPRVPGPCSTTAGADGPTG